MADWRVASRRADMTMRAQGGARVPMVHVLRFVEDMLCCKEAIIFPSVSHFEFQCNCAEC